MSTPLTQMILVRHGATDSNLARPARLQGRGVNLPLSTIGRRQAALTAELLKSRRATTLYSSPLLRAVETAEAIAAPLGLKVRVEPRLVEVHVGRWEGRDWGEIEQNDREAFENFQRDPATFGYADGETMQQVQDRVLPVFAELLARHIGEQIIVVSHNVVNRTYLAHLLEIPTRYCRHVQQDNCGINLIEHRPGSERAIVRSLNLIDHLAEAFTEYPA